MKEIKVKLFQPQKKIGMTAILWEVEITHMGIVILQKVLAAHKKFSVFHLIIKLISMNLAKTIKLLQNIKIEIKEEPKKAQISKFHNHKIFSPALTLKIHKLNYHSTSYLHSNIYNQDFQILITNSGK